MAHRKPKPRSYRFEIRLRAGMHTRLQAAVAAIGLRSAAIAQSALDEWLRERMAKLEGAVEGFMRGQIPRDAA